MFDGSLRALPISANLIMTPTSPKVLTTASLGSRKLAQALGPLHQSEARSLPYPEIGPATLPCFMALQFHAFIQVTTVVSRSRSSRSTLWMLHQPPHGM